MTKVSHKDISLFGTVFKIHKNENSMTLKLL